MAMDVEVQVDGDKAILSLRGRFDFTAHREFRQSYEGVFQQVGVKKLDIDLGGVEYIDSSALGMLLLLKENSDHAQRSVTLTNCRGAVRRVLDIAHFTKLFALS
jgi:anti-anti-sigma factor